MKRTHLATLLVLLSLAACGKKPAEEPVAPPPPNTSSPALPPGHSPINAEHMNLTSPPQAAQTLRGTVVSSIDVPQFTYIEVNQDNQTRWLASSTVALKKGDVIMFDEGVTMTDFHSKTLNRTFPSITFVNSASVVK